MPHFVNLNLSERPRILWAGEDVSLQEEQHSFRLGNFWCLHYYEYQAKVNYNSDELTISPGHMGICEPYSEIHYHSLLGDAHRHFAFNFQLPEVVKGFCWKVPLMIPQSERKIGGLFQRIRCAIDRFDEARLYAEVELWAILLQLAEKNTEEKEEDLHSVDQRRMRQAYLMVDMNITQPVYAQMLADHLEISVTHLGRLFNRFCGCSVATYIRRRRMKKAHELLTFSELPITEVAQSVGIPDLANFSRMIRKEFGLSPRKVRELSEGMKIDDLGSFFKINETDKS